MKKLVYLLATLALLTALGSPAATLAQNTATPSKTPPPGVGIAKTLSEITGVAISPLMGVGVVGAYPGLTPTPWRSGQLDHEQGVSKAGNQRLRRKMLELAWLWPIHQPDSALARWYRERLPTMTGKAARKRLAVALARKLFVALWKFVSAGVVIEGAVMKAA